MGTIIRRTLATLFFSAAVVAVGAVPAQSSVPDTPVLTGIRTGVHPTFDRIVLDFSGPGPQVSSRFVDELIQDGSGVRSPATTRLTCRSGSGCVSRRGSTCSR